MSQETMVDGDKLVIKRTFAAPVEKVYRAWTDPVQMARWLSPNVRWKTPAIDTEPKAGGRHNLTLRHTDGDEFEILGQYVDLVPNQRVSFTWIPKQGPGSGLETLVTIELRSVPAGTELTLTHDRLADVESREGTLSGWTGCLEMLEGYLEGKSLLAAG